MSGSRLADSHLHFFSRGFPDASGQPVLGAEPEVTAYEALRREHDIAAALVIGFEGDGIDPDNNRYVRTLAQARPWMATAGFVEARASVRPEAVAQILDDGHLGIAAYAPQAEAAVAMTGWPQETWQLLDAHGALVSLNAPPEAIAALGCLVGRYPNCRFLFAHLGLPGRHPVPPSTTDAARRIAPLLELSEHENALVKISGLYAVSDPAHAHPHASATPFIALLLEHIGPSRCIWGSDFAPALVHVSFAETVAVTALNDLSADERAQVMGGNLLALLGSLGWNGET